MRVNETDSDYVIWINIHKYLFFNQFLTSMFSLGMSIGKKQNTLMKAWTRVFNAIYIIILHIQCGNLHSKII